MRLSYFWFFLAAILIGGTGRLISQATTQDPVIRVSVDLVQVDATVTDSQGHHVADLKPGDFTILEDGRLQKITYFLYEQGGLSQNASRLGNVNPLAARPPVARDIRRTVVLVADDLSYEAAEFPRVRAVFKDFVDRNMQPRDLVSVMTTSGGMGELEQLTSDKRILSAAIERIVFSPARNQLGASISSENAGVAHHYDFKRDDTALAANRRPAVVTGSTIALGNAIQALRDMPGRKAVVLFTSGFSGPPAPLTLKFADTPDGKKQLNLQVVAGAYGSNSEAAVGSDKTFSIARTPEEMNQIVASGLVYGLDIEIPNPGPYQLRVAARDANSQQIGSAATFIELPDYDRPEIALSSLLLSDSDPGRNKKPASAGVMGAVSAMTQAFAPGATLNYTCAVYGASMDKVTLKPMLDMEVRLFHGQEQIFASKLIPLTTEDRPLDSIRAAGVIKLPPTLPVGDYAVELIVYDRMQKTKLRQATQFVDFTLQK
ncbi:MAG TPA: VWA domain-containing protein [Bryobacteraceae bacterium]|nr:VWA domain-containing protein [Bryobacteraceae bacterium]